MSADIFRRVDHVEIVPRDATRSIDFYTGVLGFSLAQRVPVKMPPLREVSYLRLGDTVIEILDVEAPEAKSSSAWPIGFRALALEVGDMDEALRHLREHGVTISIEPVDLGDSLRGEILDPDGLTIEIRQWKQRAW